MRRICVATLISFAISPVVGGAQVSTSPLPIETLASERYLRRECGLSLSPDGTLAAFGLHDGRRQVTATPDEAFTANGTYLGGVSCDIFIVDVQTGAMKDVTGGIGNNWGPSWSPDGEQLAFFSDRGGRPQLWIWRRTKDGIRQVSEALIRSADPVQWEPDGKSVVTRIVPEGLTPEQAHDLPLQGIRDSVNGVLVYKSEPSAGSSDSVPRRYARTQPWSLDNSTVDLAVIDLGTGKVSRSARGYRIAVYRVSSDGREVAFSVYKGFEHENEQGLLFDLVLCSLNRDNCKDVATDIHPVGFGEGFSWSPDDRMLAYVADGKLSVITRDSGKIRELAPPSGERFSGKPYWNLQSKSLYLTFSQALWKVDLEDGRTSFIAALASDSRQNLLVLPDHSRICLLDHDKSILLQSWNTNTWKAGLFSVDLASGKSKTLWQEDQYITDVALSDKTLRIVYAAEESNHPSDLWSVSLDGGSPKRITHLNPEFDRYPLGTARPVAWTTLHGQPARGALLLPANYSPNSKYPLVICVYAGGDLPYGINSFGQATCGGTAGLAQLLASRGFAVLTTGPPVRVGVQMEDVASGVLPSIDFLSAVGIVDAEKVGVIGQSAGGYDVSSLIVDTRRLKAAVMTSGYADPFSSYGFLSPDGSSYDLALMETVPPHNMGVPPWENPERYVENSPMFHLDRVQTPLLIAHGSSDHAVPSYLGDQVFVGLRRLGKRAEYVKYEQEGHTPATWSYQHRLDYYTRVVRWFEQYLK